MTFMNNLDYDDWKKKNAVYACMIKETNKAYLHINFKNIRYKKLAAI